MEHTKKKIIELQNKFSDHIRSLKNLPIIVSDESWMGGTYSATHLNYANHIHMVDLLKNIFPNAKIILTIRRQDKLLESIYKHSIRDGYCQNLNCFLNYENDIFNNYTSFYRKGINIDVRTLNYITFIERYIERFGKDNVLVVPQEVIEDDISHMTYILSKYLNHKIDNIDISNKKVNAGLNYYGIKITRNLNRFFIFKNRDAGFIPQGKDIYKKYYYKKNNRKVDKYIKYILYKFNPISIGKLFDKLLNSRNKPLINSELRKKILKIHNNNNQKLQEYCTFDLEKYGYYKKKPKKNKDKM